MNSLYLIEIVKSYKEFIQGSIKVAEYNPFENVFIFKDSIIDADYVKKLRKISFKG